MNGSMATTMTTTTLNSTIMTGETISSNSRRRQQQQQQRGRKDNADTCHECSTSTSCCSSTAVNPSNSISPPPPSSIRIQRHLYLQHRNTYNTTNRLFVVAFPQQLEGHKTPPCCAGGAGGHHHHHDSITNGCCSDSCGSTETETSTSTSASATCAVITSSTCCGGTINDHDHDGTTHHRMNALSCCGGGGACTSIKTTKPTTMTNTSSSTGKQRSSCCSSSSTCSKTILPATVKAKSSCCAIQNCCAKKKQLSASVAAHHHHHHHEQYKSNGSTSKFCSSTTCGSTKQLISVKAPSPPLPLLTQTNNADPDDSATTTIVRSQFFIQSGLCCSSEVPVIKQLIHDMNLPVVKVMVNPATKLVFVDHSTPPSSSAAAAAATSTIAQLIEQHLTQEGFDTIIKRDGEMELRLTQQQQQQEESLNTIVDVNHNDTLPSSDNIQMIETPSIRWNVILSGICWVISMMSVLEFINPIWIYCKYVGICSMIFGLPPVMKKAFNSLKRRHVDSNVMMVLAAIGAALLGEYDEAASVSFLFAISEWLESRATLRAQRALSSIIQLKPETAHLLLSTNGLSSSSRQQQATRIVPASSVKVGQHVLVKQGDKVPTDGIVIEGSSHVDESSLTGEALPVHKTRGNQINGGTLNVGSGVLVVKVTATTDNSAVSRLIKLVEEAQTNRSDTEMLVDQFASKYTPTVLFMAICMATIPWLFVEDTMTGRKWLFNALIVVVVACPCALTISTPVTYAAGLAATAQHGIIIKGGKFLESLGQIGHVVFDKTGTLTHGTFTLDKLVVMKQKTTTTTTQQTTAATASLDKRQCLQLLAHMEQHASHPMAHALIEAAIKEGCFSSNIDEKQNNNNKQNAAAAAAMIQQPPSVSCCQGTGCCAVASAAENAIDTCCTSTTLVPMASSSSATDDDDEEGDFVNHHHCKVSVNGFGKQKKSCSSSSFNSKSCCQSKKKEQEQQPPPWFELSNHVALEGEGIQASITFLQEERDSNNSICYVGNTRLMTRLGYYQTLSEGLRQEVTKWSNEGATVGFLALSQIGIVAVFSVRDTLRQEAPQVIQQLRNKHGCTISLLTGDTEGAAYHLAKRVGLHLPPPSVQPTTTTTTTPSCCASATNNDHHHHHRDDEHHCCDTGSTSNHHHHHQQQQHHNHHNYDSHGHDHSSCSNGGATSTTENEHYSYHNHHNNNNYDVVAAELLPEHKLSYVKAMMLDRHPMNQKRQRRSRRQALLDKLRLLRRNGGTPSKHLPLHQVDSMTDLQHQDFSSIETLDSTAIIPVDDDDDEEHGISNDHQHHCMEGDNQRSSHLVCHTIWERCFGSLSLFMNHNNKKNLILFCGDGVNDAPAMAAADVGVAMGGGATVAMEMSDITLMESSTTSGSSTDVDENDDSERSSQSSSTATLSKLIYCMEMGQRVLTTIQQNIAISLLSKLVVILLTFFGKTSLLLAIASDVGIMLIVTLNGMKLLPACSDDNSQATKLQRWKTLRSRRKTTKKANKNLVYSPLDGNGAAEDNNSSCTCVTTQTAAAAASTTTTPLEIV